MSQALSLTFASRQSGVAGTLQIIAVDEDFPMPVGILFYRLVGNATADILWIYVIPALRRNGIARAMVRFLTKLGQRENLRLLMTTHGSAEGGAALLQALAFTQNPVTKDWTLPVLAVVDTPPNDTESPERKAAS